MEGRAKILVVDDDNDFIDSVRTVLEAKPYDVVIARHGDKGLQKARAENPDLILPDVIMPDEGGFTAAEQFKQAPELSSIPVIMLTAFSSKVGETSIPRRWGYILDTEDCIEPPFRPRDLLAAVEKALERLSS